MLKRVLKKIVSPGDNEASKFTVQLRKMGLHHLYTTDTFIVSYPKSGNTWVRFIVANLLEQLEPVTFRNIENYVQDIYKSADKINSLSEGRFIKSHDTFFENYARSIYIYRDGRDAMVSYYHYALQRNYFSGTFSEFVRSATPERFGSWSQHVDRGIDFYLKNQSSVLLLKYENMVANPVEAVKQIASFIHISSDDALINKVVEKCSFASLQKNEDKFGTEYKEVDMKFFRKGQIGDWRSTFSESDHEYFLLKSAATLVRTGYTLAY